MLGDIPEIPSVELPPNTPVSSESLETSSDLTAETEKNLESPESLGNLTEEAIQKVDEEGFLSYGSAYENNLDSSAEQLGVEKPPKIEEIDKEKEKLIEETKRELLIIANDNNLELAENPANNEVEIEQVEGDIVEENVMDDEENNNGEEEEVVDAEWRQVEEEDIRRWAEEDINPETIEILKENGLEELGEKLTPEQQEYATRVLNQILDRMKFVDNNTGLSALNLLDKMPTEEQDRFKEFMKLMLRLAVKMTAKITSIVAKNIAKSTDDKTLKFLCGTFADLTDFGEAETQKLITGEAKPEDLSVALRKVLLDRK